jgi:hypothetical protein
MKTFIAALSVLAFTGLANSAGADVTSPALALGCNVTAPDVQFLVAPPCPEVPTYVPEKARATFFVKNLQSSHNYSFIWTNCQSTTASCWRSVLLSLPTQVSVLVTDNTTGAQQSLSIIIGYDTIVVN